MICESTNLQTGHLMFGTVYLSVVLSDTVNTFKSKLDKFWQQQPIIHCVPKKNVAVHLTL